MQTSNRTAADLDEVLAASVAARDLPFVVAAVADRNGLLWSGAAGRDESGDVPFDAVLRIYSQTKSIGATALLILAERGLIALDTPVAQVLPEFGAVRVFDGVGPDGPILRAPVVECTVRHLLTHTSGLAYEGLDERMTAYRAATGEPVTGILGIETLYRYPFVFEPGTDFAYGVGVDWIGAIVERLDGRPIERFCVEEIFEPLGMVDTVFEADERPGRVPPALQRTAEGDLRVVPVAPPARPELYGLGTCLYSTAHDYLRFLRMVLRGGELDGRRILTPASVALLTDDQLPPGITVRPIRSDDHTWSCDIDPFPGVRASWTAGFFRVEEDIPRMRSAGSLSWGGILNSHFWIDPVNDLAAVFMTQALPFCDPRVMGRFHEFERAVYRQPSLRQGGTDR